MLHMSACTSIKVSIFGMESRYSREIEKENRFWRD